MSTPSYFEVVTELVYDSENDELYTIYDDEQVDAEEEDERDFEPDTYDVDDEFGGIGPGVDDFDDNAWGID